MIDITNKQRGNCGLGIAIGYFSTNDYIVSIPLNDTQDYDLIIDKDNKLKSVFIATDQLDMYLIPVEEVKNKSTLNLCDKYKRYKVS